MPVLWLNMTSSARRDLAASLQEFGLERDRMRAALARRAGLSQTDLDALEHLENAAAEPVVWTEQLREVSASLAALSA